MKRFVEWIAKELVKPLGQELEALRMTQLSYQKLEAERYEREAERYEREAERYEREAERYEREAEHYEREAEHYEQEAARYEREAERLARIEARLGEVSAILAQVPDATRLDLKTRFAEQERAFGERIDASLATAEEKQRKEIPLQVRAELAPVLGQLAQQISWSKDTAHVVGELRAETRLLIEAPDPLATAEDGDSDDPQLLRRYLQRSNIRELYPTELFPGVGEVSMPIASINEESGHGNQVDLMYVAAIAKVREARSIFEFGTYLGRTTYHLTYASKDAHVTTLNLPPEDEAAKESLGRMFRGTDREERITQLLADSAEFDPTPYAQSMDFIFVDADHSYELVKNDSVKALTMLKPGGAIVWHDYAVKSPGVVRYIQEFTEERPAFRLKHTCLIIYLDGVDAMTFQPRQRASSAASLKVASPRRVQDGEQRMQHSEALARAAVSRASPAADRGR